MLLPINYDLYDIAWRVKQIDDSYYFMFCTIKNKYLLYSNKGYELTLPYDELDNRALMHVRETRIENLEALISKIDKFNKDKEKDDLTKLQSTFNEKAEEALRQL